MNENQRLGSFPFSRRTNEFYVNIMSSCLTVDDDADQIKRWALTAVTECSVCLEVNQLSKKLYELTRIQIVLIENLVTDI